MNNLQYFFEIEEKFSKYNRFVTLTLAAYYLFVFAFGRYVDKQELIFAGSLLFFMFIDCLAGNYKYWNHRLLFRISKLLILTFAAICMIYNGGIYLSIALLTVIYVMIMFQYFFLFDVVELFYRISAIVETVAPLMIVSCTQYIFFGESNFEVFLVTVFLTAFVTVVMSDLSVASGIIQKLLNDMFRKERLAINSHQEYENLKVYQSRLVRANEQLSIQKFQMEQLNESIYNRNQQMDLQYRILKHITSALDIEKLMDFITSGIIDNIRLDMCVIFVYDTSADKDVKEKFYSIKYSTESRLNERTIDSFIEYAQSEEIIEYEGECIVNNYVEAGRYEFLKNSNISSLMIYPIHISDTNRGLLAIGKNSSGYFTENNKDFYKSIVEQIILAVNNASMYTKMQDMATKDPLTSIYNRRHFNAVFPGFIKKSAASGKPLTVILFDIDKFKNVNDQYGHLFGDQVIRFCGSVAGKAARRNGGLAVRYGGEEFVLFFPDKKIETVMRVIEDLHTQIREHKFDYEGSEVHINVSIGISSYPETCDDLEDLVNRADLAMYHSKNTGRGRITIDGLEEKTK